MVLNASHNPRLFSSSKFVVGSSNAKIPQLTQNVSANAIRMTKEANCFWLFKERDGYKLRCVLDDVATVLEVTCTKIQPNQEKKTQWSKPIKIQPTSSYPALQRPRMSNSVFPLVMTMR